MDSDVKPAIKLEKGQEIVDFSATNPTKIGNKRLVCYMDVELLSDDKHCQLTQISCLLVDYRGGCREYFAVITPTYLDTYNNYK